MIIINPGNRPSIFQRIFPHTPALLGKCFLQSVFHIWELHFKLRSWRYWSDETWRGLKVLSPKFGMEWSQNRHKLSHTMWPMKPSWYLKHMSRSSKRASMMKMWNWLLNATLFQILEKLKKFVTARRSEILCTTSTTTDFSTRF